MALYQVKILPLHDHFEGTDEITPYLLLRYRGLVYYCSTYVHTYTALFGYYRVIERLNMEILFCLFSLWF
jgi:hypothetical protein